MDHKVGDKGWIRSFYDAAAGWWGESWYEGENLQSRLEIVRKYGNNTDNRILELAAGTGETAACLCDHGYAVLAVDMAHGNIELMAGFHQSRPDLRVLEGDYMSLQINEQFPTVCMFESFGFGSDREQQQLLKRVCDHWLIPGGVLILDVYHPAVPIRTAGKKQELDRLENVPGSVDMTEYSYFDPVKSRWIDIWEPKDNKEQRRMQSIRCYMPADFMLVAACSGLSIEKMLYCGKEFDHASEEVTIEDIFDDENTYSYTVVLRK